MGREPVQAFQGGEEEGRPPEEEDVEEGDSQVSVVLRSQPDQGPSQEESIEAVEPPEPRTVAFQEESHPLAWEEGSERARH